MPTVVILQCQQPFHHNANSSYITMPTTVLLQYQQQLYYNANSCSKRYQQQFYRNANSSSIAMPTTVLLHYQQQFYYNTNSSYTTVPTVVLTIPTMDTFSQNNGIHLLQHCVPINRVCDPECSHVSAQDTTATVAVNAINECRW